VYALIAALKLLGYGKRPRDRKMSETVADVLVGAREQIGVKHIFGLIGDSLNPLADAVRRSKVEWIGVRHEEGAALRLRDKQS
jgi:glyoxylate carboligase